jgi:hypothetical protein
VSEIVWFYFSMDFVFLNNVAILTQIQAFPIVWLEVFLALTSKEYTILVYATRIVTMPRQDISVSMLILSSIEIKLHHVLCVLLYQLPVTCKRKRKIWFYSLIQPHSSSSDSSFPFLLLLPHFDRRFLNLILFCVANPNSTPPHGETPHCRAFAIAWRNDAMPRRLIQLLLDHPLPAWRKFVWRYGEGVRAWCWLAIVGLPGLTRLPLPMS